jgi:hypothetical protein
MKLVYLAGPYRAPTPWELVQNIRRAEALALEVWKAGAACICPHKNTALFDGAADDTVWLEGDLEMLRRCDAVLCTDNWSESRGARDEVELARDVGIPVLQSVAELEAWLQSFTTNNARSDLRALGTDRRANDMR